MNGIPAWALWNNIGGQKRDKKQVTKGGPNLISFNGWPKEKARLGGKLADGEPRSSVEWLRRALVKRIKPGNKGENG